MYVTNNIVFYLMLGQKSRSALLVQCMTLSLKNKQMVRDESIVEHLTDPDHCLAAGRKTTDSLFKKLRPLNMHGWQPRKPAEYSEDPKRLVCWGVNAPIGLRWPHYSCCGAKDQESQERAECQIKEEEWKEGGLRFPCESQGSTYGAFATQNAEV